jgi:hypothetical protein
MSKLEFSAPLRALLRHRDERFLSPYSPKKTQSAETTLRKAKSDTTEANHCRSFYPSLDRIYRPGRLKQHSRRPLVVIVSIFQVNTVRSSDLHSILNRHAVCCQMRNMSKSLFSGCALFAVAAALW